MAGSLWSCTDHRNSPAAPQRLRLKATDNSIPQASSLADYQGRTEYSYDQMGRLASVFRPGVSRTLFMYDEQNRVLRYMVQGELSPDFYWIVLEYLVGGSSATVQSYKNSDRKSPFSTDPTGTISFGTDGRVTNWSTGVGPNLHANSYTYTGDNITHISEAFSRTQTSSLQEYDSKLNPFYGLITPDYTGIITDISRDDVVRRSNRNNVIKYSIVDRTSGNVTKTTLYEYDYNAQGLPIKARVTGQPGELVFTYEAY